MPIRIGLLTIALVLTTAVATAQITPPAAPPPAANPAPVTPAPATPVPATPPAATVTPGEPSDPFGAEITLAEKNIVFMKGTGNWDSAFETLTDTFKSLYDYLDKQGVKPAGPAMTIYTATDDTGFQFQAAVPIETPLSNPPRGDIAAGKSPSGRAYHFVHRGSYDAMDTTYEAITNFLDEKKLEAKDMFIEEYITDLRTTPEDQLVVNVFVPIK
ncbi:MAG: GyrI-like domain-containing protein [Pseudorhodoplanes sp.]